MLWYKKGNMKITQQNYERYLIDFMDGNLDPSLKEELRVFLDEHPDIKAEFEDLEIIDTNIDEDICFDLKANLKKSPIASSKNINENNHEDYFIASAEKDLSDAEEAELEQFINLNPKLAESFQLYKKTKVQADLSINYPNKKSLKKYPFYQRKAWYYATSAAASVLILLSILFFSKSNDLTRSNYAQEKQINIPEKMNYISVKAVIDIPKGEITINYRSITIPAFANLEDLIIQDEKIQMLQARINIKENLASLQTDFQAPLFIQNKSFYLQNFAQTNFASAQQQGKNKKVAKSIWNSLFAKFKSNKRQIEGGSNERDVKKIKPLWLLANIGLERINEVTGTKMRLQKKPEEGSTREIESIDIEKTRSAN